MLSPGGLQHYNPDTYEPSKFLDHTKLSASTEREVFGQPYPTSEVEKYLKEELTRGNPLKLAHDVPHCIIHKLYYKYLIAGKGQNQSPEEMAL